jgi:hypothetical protein
VKLRVGQTLYSAVDEATVVVIRAPDDDVTVTYGGAEMSEAKVDGATGGASGTGLQLGKRYADDDIGIELLCSKAGAGTLEVNGAELPLKESKPLPASD